jgi:hypothetical protein
MGEGEDSKLEFRICDSGAKALTPVNRLLRGAWAKRHAIARRQPQKQANAGLMC